MYTQPFQTVRPLKSTYNGFNILSFFTIVYLMYLLWAYTGLDDHFLGRKGTESRVSVNWKCEMYTFLSSSIISLWTIRNCIPIFFSLYRFILFCISHHDFNWITPVPRTVVRRTRSASTRSGSPIFRRTSRKTNSGKLLQHDTSQSKQLKARFFSWMFRL